MAELIGAVEDHRAVEGDVIARIATRLGVSPNTVWDRYREAIRPIVGAGLTLSLHEQEAIRNAPDRRTAVRILQADGRHEGAVLLLDAIARSPGPLLLDLRQRDPIRAQIDTRARRRRGCLARRASRTSQEA